MNKRKFKTIKGAKKFREKLRLYDKTQEIQIWESRENNKAVFFVLWNIN